MLIRVIIPTVIGGVIGWVTNVLAIKMLFRPTYPIHIPILGIDIQGLLPKRKEEIAISIGETIEEELINIDEILNIIAKDENRKDALMSIKSAITERISKKMPVLIPFVIKESIIAYIEEQIDKEAPGIIEEIIKKLYEKASSDIKIGKMIEEKIRNIDLLQLERITIRIAQKELKHIEILGGILGALIGFLQGLAISFIY